MGNCAMHPYRTKPRIPNARLVSPLEGLFVLLPNGVSNVHCMARRITTIIWLGLAT